MNRAVAAAALLVIQVALVLSVAGKYLYERKTRPRVWVRTAQFDPTQPLRGRYLALQLSVDACGLPHDPGHFFTGYRVSPTSANTGTYTWRASLAVEDGHLVPILEDHARSPENLQSLTQFDDRSCESVPLSSVTEFFVPDTAKPPFPLKQGEELWVEVTVPASGPPRPIQLALSDMTGFHLISFE